MIHTIYDHGGDDPATGLSTAQMSGALRDAAGTLWVDLEAPTAAEQTTILTQALSLEPAAAPSGDAVAAYSLVSRPRHLRLAATVPSDGPSRAAPLTVYLGANFVVTVQPGAKFIAAIRDATTGGLPTGAAGLAARVVTAAAVAWSLRLADLERRFGELEDAVTRRSGPATGAALYEARREIETLKQALPAMAANCRALSDESVQFVTAAARPAFVAAAEVLEGQARAADRLAVRGDLAMAAHTADIAARIAGALRWSIVATLAVGAAVAAAVLAAGR